MLEIHFLNGGRPGENAFLKVPGTVESLRGHSGLKSSAHWVKSLGVSVATFNHSLKELGFMYLLLAISSDDPILLFLRLSIDCRQTDGQSDLNT